MISVIQWHYEWLYSLDINIVWYVWNYLEHARRENQVKIKNNSFEILKSENRMKKSTKKYSIAFSIENKFDLQFIYLFMILTFYYFENEDKNETSLCGRFKAFVWYSVLTSINHNIFQNIVLYYILFIIWFLCFRLFSNYLPILH